MAANKISEVIDQLNEIVNLAEQKADRAGYFAALYKRVTIAVFKKIKEGYFNDNARMEKLDVVFANRYLEAYYNYASGKPCTSSWQLAFDATKSWKPMVIHHLLTGMNAHISLDLGIAAATVSPGSAINDVHNDFNKINTVLKELITEVRSELFDMWPLSKMITSLHTDKLEKDVAGFSMTIARDAAWQVALDYASLNNITSQEKYISERDLKVSAFGKKFLNPNFWQSFLGTFFRIFEFGSISNKIKKLNR